MMQKLLPFGIHFGLDAEIYHADPGLGSTNIKTLFRSPPSYWHDSWMNPTRKVKPSTRGQERGSAMHKLLYEGEAAFDAIYMRGPDQDGMSTAEKTASTKEANARGAKLGKTVLKADDYDQVAMAVAMITKNPKLANVFTNGFGEVSVFWERDGIRLKARLDYLKARGVGDAKAVANQYDEDFPTACKKAIANYRYDMQCAHYLDARALVPKMVADGMVYGDHDHELLLKIASAKEYAWQFIFYQSEGAPITWSRIISPQNPMVEFAGSHVRQAIDNFKIFRETFGESMWLLIDEPRELFLEDMPNWYAR